MLPERLLVGFANGYEFVRECPFMLIDALAVLRVQCFSEVMKGLLLAFVLTSFFFLVSAAC